MSAQRHPVADLLRPEDKERVKAATFERLDVVGVRLAGHPSRCPLSVALGISASLSTEFCRGFGVTPGGPEQMAIMDFMQLADLHCEPEDIYVMLGCAEALQ